MKIVVIGAVAGGTSAAAKASRGIPEAEIVMYEKDTFISYAACGIPYYIGGEVEKAEQLTPRDVSFFKKKYNIDVKIAHRVLAFNPIEKTLQVKNLNTGEVFQDTYDKLVIGTGSQAKIPPIKGTNLENVFTCRTIGDMYKIKQFIDGSSPQTAAIIGTGFIGMEMAENLKGLGMEVSIIGRSDQIMSNLDVDMSIYIEKHLKEKGVNVVKGASTKEIRENQIMIEDGRKIDADLVILATGIAPNVEMAKEAGIEIGVTGAIKVNKRLETNYSDIYACGDCMEQYHAVTGKPVYIPLGSTANKTGRIVGENLSGENSEFRGILGTNILRIFDITVAQTGLTEKAAQEEGYSIEVVKYNQVNKPRYIGGKSMTIKAVADKANGKMLGVQIIGEEGVDKQIDVFATAITYGAKAKDLFHLDLAYAPPYSNPKGPVHYAGMILKGLIEESY